MKKKIKIDWQKIFFFSSLVISFALGIFAGITIEQFDKIENRQPIEIVPQNHEKIPLINFLKIENGVMYGKTGEKEVRFIVGEDSIFGSNGGEFQFPVDEILPMLKSLPAPDDMQFVASKRGKRYWPLDAPQAFLLAPQNRIFFKTPEEAEEQGYKKGE